jgi:hypothetical protein
VKKILIVSGNRISPATTGGQVHSLSIARALSRSGYSVRIYSVTGRRDDYSLANSLRGATLEEAIEPNLTEGVHVGLFFGLLQAIGRRLDLPRAWQYACLRVGIIPGGLREALRQADIVISDLPYCPPIPGPWKSKPWFLVSHNLEHKLLQQAGPRQRRFAEWMRRIESAAPRTYSDILACAEEDQAFFRANDSGSCLALPIVRCGVDPRAYSFTQEMRDDTRGRLGFQEQDKVIMFSGSGFAPNVEAFQEIKDFCRAEAQFLARHRVRLMVVGSVSASAFTDGALVVTGPVAAILPFFSAADAGINMVTRGSGSNVKLFEYLAARLPVISTQFGVRGSELQAYTDYLPCTRADLRTVIEFFLAQDRSYWRSHAESVWQRHRRSCDIQDLVGDAVAQLPAFAV